METNYEYNRSYGSIKAYTGYSDRYKIHYYHTFAIKKALPKIGDVIYYEGENVKDTEYYYEERIKEIIEITLDCEQDRHEVYEYNYYCIIVQEYKLEDGEEDVDEIEQYIAIEREYEDEDPYEENEN